MADPVVNNSFDAPAADIDMAGADDELQIVEAPAAAAAEAANNAEDDEDVEIADDELPKRVTFLDYLKSPIVELVIGQESARTTLSAHQDLLTQSPYFEQKCADFTAGGVRRIELGEDDVDAMGSFLEYLYKGDYFPKRMADGQLETDASTPAIDEDGDQLLRHARIYNLAEKFYMPLLKQLAHSKIHRTTSTALGEIQYARYVYKTTLPTDTTIRKPIATFWATRSHVLRHEAEEEFRAMCLEYPQFGFDVLSLVLDHKEQSDGSSGGVSQMATVGVPVTETPTTVRGRKRARGAL